MEIFKKQFLDKARAQAIQSGHVFPDMAACEAALECGFATSALAIKYNNLFGMKQHEHPVYGTVVLPTKEFLNHGWVVVNASWVTYPDYASCFKDRMDTLQRLQHVYPHYGAALSATDPITYINEVSKSWSTDPDRAAKVIAIYNNR
jgi:flagellum-specific peptidoglycan hydrolase FlgJ